LSCSVSALGWGDWPIIAIGVAHRQAFRKASRVHLLMRDCDGVD
jgi:hypothetical protein